MLSAVLVASIAVAVILGYKTKINTGFFCIAFVKQKTAYGIRPRDWSSDVCSSDLFHVKEDC